MVADAPPFAELLRRFRSNAALSQEALAERAGISVAAVASLERGRRTSPRPETIALLAQGLGLSSEERETFVASAFRLQPAAPAVETAPEPASYTALLSTPLTSLVGRERDVAAVLHLLQRPEGSGRARLLTLIGPGGVGKTRLALAAALAVQHEYADGVYFVSLAALRDPEAVVSLIASTLGLRETRHQTVQESIINHLRERQLLLVLDNLEQVLDVAPLVGEWLALCPRLVVLATSRIALRLRGEQRFPVPPLPTPPPAALPALEEIAGFGAVRLFVERAQAVQPEFALSQDNAQVIAQVCRRLDGLPLAIELAAARVMLLPPAALLARLERRLPVLTGGARDLPDRQRTLRATIAWSYDLLDSDERILFRRLAVFTGGCTQEAATAVCRLGGALDVLEGLASLIDKSLVSSGVAQSEMRFGMLETVREYALEQLEASGEAAAVRRAHAAYYVAFAEAAEPDLRGAKQMVMLKRLEDEHDNLRAVLQWSLLHAEAEVGLRLGSALWRFWYVRGYSSEGRRWLAELLALPGSEAGGNLAFARAAVLCGAGTFAEFQGDYAEARKLFEESLAISQSHGEKRIAAASLNSLGVVADSQGDLGQAATFFTHALELFRGIGDRWGTALVLGNMGYLAREQGAYARAVSLQADSVALFRELGDTRNLAFSLNNLGEVMGEQGDYRLATALCEESLALRRTLGDTWGIAISLASLGNMALAQGEYARAGALQAESLALFRNLGATWNAACSLDSLSNAARKQGAYERAAALSNESLALFREIHDAKGTARALTSAGQVAREQGDGARAEELFRESLALYRGKGSTIGMVSCLEGLAQVLGTPAGDQTTARIERAVRLWGATVALREA
ncbi:MAG TPA: tetratricopeptide repeat protein, partial [Chloroflexota bacterium]|nr:tetratricopeptide repeat protein [Chloroflexota bacterium]